MVSHILFEKPHSLSYQDNTLLNLPLITCVWVKSNIELCGLWLKSLDTNGSEFVARIPFNGPLKGILATNSAPLVSKDFNHNPHSSIFDLTQTQVIKGKFSRVLSWYDNEWGFSNRMCDTAIQIAGLV